MRHDAEREGSPDPLKRKAWAHGKGQVHHPLTVLLLPQPAVPASAAGSRVLVQVQAAQLDDSQQQRSAPVFSSRPDCPCLALKTQWSRAPLVALLTVALGLVWG